ncbi:hypothetical protein GCM10009804_38650 [Kribbella hippodromi]|uniref:Uncharacterized protein n=1 Tax=Kribbella hippodromi TaxID=434347 RepID=A0ABN2DJ62_9ACTN
MKRRPGSAITTLPKVNHRTIPTRLCPTNRIPGTGPAPEAPAPADAPADPDAPAPADVPADPDAPGNPADPDDQVTLVHSGLHSCIRGRSLTNRYSASAVDCTVMDSVRSGIGFSLAVGSCLVC